MPAAEKDLAESPAVLHFPVIFPLILSEIDQEREWRLLKPCVDGGDDAAAAHALAAAGVGAEPPEVRQHRSQQCCGVGGERGEGWAWRGAWIRRGANRVLSDAAFF